MELNPRWDFGELKLWSTLGPEIFAGSPGRAEFSVLWVPASGFVLAHQGTVTT